MNFDKHALIEHFEGDGEIITELVELFEVSYPETLEKLKLAITENNTKEIELHAHTLKGMLANFFASNLREKAFKIEQMGKNKNTENALVVYNEILSIIPELVEDLKKITIPEES